MAKSPALARAFQMFRDAFANLEQASENLTDAAIAELRARDDALFGGFTPPDAIVEPVDAAGVPSLWVRVPNSSDDRAVVWFHGGGYVIGSAAGRRGIAAAISRAAGCRVLLADYRRAPEHRFPFAVEDAVASYSWVSDRIGPTSVVLGGDSAGGGIAIAAQLLALQRGLPLPAASVTIAPMVDRTHSGDTYRTNKEFDPFVPLDMVTKLGQMYLDGHDPRDPLASPLYGDLTGLPPMLILVGSTEALLDDARNLARAVGRAGGEVDLRVFEDMFHLWPLFASILPEGQHAIDLMAGFIWAHTGGRAAPVRFARPPAWPPRG